MIGLSKSKIMAHRQCPKRLWLQAYQPELASESPTARIAMENGTQIGEAARTIYPGGTLIDTKDMSLALTQTQTALQNHPARPLFEGTFQHDGVLVRADILVPNGDGTHLIEVKSSSAVKDYQIDDIAIQAWVIREAGLPLNSLFVAYTDKNFRYAGNGSYDGLIRPTDVTTVAQAIIPKIEGWVDAARKTLSGPVPDIQCGKQCKQPYTCPFLSHCNTDDASAAAYPLDDLYKASKKFKQTLSARGFRDIRDIPPEMLTSDQHRRIQKAATDGKPYLDDKAGKKLRAAPYPRHYFDFETMSVGLPIWPDTAFHMVIPFQWSCHIERAPGQIEHHEFLANGSSDPRRDCAESLIASLGTEGPIYAYHASFEKQRLQALADELPDLAAHLLSIAKRLICLERMTLASYYHPSMHGSWSLKRILPTVAQQLDYANLAVSDGIQAQVAFAEIMSPQTSSERQAELRRQLLEYCGRDTEGLISLARFLENAVAC